MQLFYRGSLGSKCGGSAPAGPLVAGSGEMAHPRGRVSEAGRTRMNVTTIEYRSLE